MERLVSAIRENAKKMQDYYLRFGLAATVIRVVKKITKYDYRIYMKWYKKNRPTAIMLKHQSEQEFLYTPKVSIVVPLYKTPENYLKDLIESVKKQSYSNWELCLSDGSGKDTPLKNVLKQYEVADERIKVVQNKVQLHISDNTNEALKIASGDYIAFADHDDLLAPNALYECVRAINEEPSTEIIYTDEDKIDMQGRTHFLPHFKSDFSIDKLRSGNYICHFFVVKREIFEKVGFLRHDYDGAQDFDFVMRCVEVSSNVKHIPQILYHWRAHKNSTAENPESKNYAYEAGVKVLQEHYKRQGINATVEQSQHKGIYRTRYRLFDNPLISVIIANKDHAEDLDKCIMSIQEKSAYKNYEIIVVENNSVKTETFTYYKELENRYNNVKVTYWKGKDFNYSSINNFGVQHAKGEYLLFLNNDTEMLNENSLQEMLGYCMRKDVGAVGTRLYYGDKSIQHAGIIIGLGGVAGHAFAGSLYENPGYCGRIHMVQNYSAVTAACMMVKKRLFEEMQGFDERYAVAFNDVDFCLRLRKKGYLIVYTPYAEFFHYESKTRGYEDTLEKQERFGAEKSLLKENWKTIFEEGDPYYNPNLTLDKTDFSLRK